MLDTTINTLDTTKAKPSELKWLGAYGSATGVQPDVAPALAKTNPSLNFTDPDKHWLKELGITSTHPRDFQNAWATDAFRHRPLAWSDSYGGRIAIRTFSRGILGAAFFAGGQIFVGTEKFGLKGYNPDTALLQQKSPLKFFAKLIDLTLGNGIYKAVKFVSGSEEKALGAITFRNTRQYASYKDGSTWIRPKTGPHGNPEYLGRSLGDESISITFDFGLASLGDYTGREIAAVLDPNISKTWLKDGHLDMPLALKAMLKSVWTGVTRAMGEDYFAMLMGYPYIVRLSRGALNHFSPGFKNDSDHALNGGSVRLDDHNELNGNFQAPGMMDLGVRFTIYNFFTKLYRDFYDWTGDKIKRRWEGDKTLDFGHDLLSAIRHLPHTVARTIIKMTIIMVPTMPFFFIPRSTQSKDVGLAIHPQKGPMGIKVNDSFYPINASGTFRSRRSETLAVPANQRNAVFKNGEQLDFDQTKFKGFNPYRGKSGEGYEQRYAPYETHAVWHDRIINPIGRFSYNTSQVLTEFLKQIFGVGAKDGRVSNLARFSRSAAYASLAYTPYFAMKTDVLTAAWDTPRMDMAIDRTLHGLEHFRFGEFTAGASEIGHTILGRPFKEHSREEEAQTQMMEFENKRPGEAEQNAARLQPAQPRKVFATEDLKKKLITPLAASRPAPQPITPRNPSWQKEQMMKQFDQITPQGHAIN